MTPRDLEMFEKGMDAVFLVLEETVPKMTATRLDDILAKAGMEITADMRPLAKLWNLLVPSVLNALAMRVKHDSKRLLQEMTCMVHDLDPEHMRKMAEAARGAGIDPGAWRRA